MGFPNPGQQAAQMAQQAAQMAQQAGLQAAQQGMQAQQARLQTWEKRKGRSRSKPASCATMFFVVLVLSFVAVAAVFLFNLM
jgi:hypothetical protein